MESRFGYGLTEESLREMWNEQTKEQLIEQLLYALESEVRLRKELDKLTNVIH